MVALGKILLLFFMYIVAVSANWATLGRIARETECEHKCNSRITSTYKNGQCSCHCQAD